MSGTIKAVLIDLSGTLHVGNHVTPGASDALKKLRSTGVSVKFITNTTKESRYTLHRRLSQIGLNVSLDEMYSSLSAANDYVCRERLNPFLLVTDDAKEEFTSVTSEKGEPNAVVVGLAPDKFKRDNMNYALKLLLQGSKLIAIHAGRYYRSEKGLNLGPGLFTKAFEYASEVQPILIGKPNPKFFYSVLEKTDATPEETIMIGDDVFDDIKGAQDVSIRGILVKTGKYTAGDELKINPSPFSVRENFSEAVDFIYQLIKKQPFG